MNEMIFGNDNGDAEKHWEAVLVVDYQNEGRGNDNNAFDGMVKVRLFPGQDTVLAFLEGLSSGTNPATQIVALRLPKAAFRNLATQINKITNFTHEILCHVEINQINNMLED